MHPAVRAGALLLTEAVAVPALRITERLGVAPRLFTLVEHRARASMGAGFGFGDYQPGPQDAIICTYPKSGTNWMLQIVHQIATLGHGEFGHIHDVAPWPDAYREQAIPLSDEGWRHTPTGLRAVKTHLESDRVPYDESARYIHVVRDPKDVFVSQYHFLRGLVFGPLMPSVETWLELFVRGEFTPVPSMSWPAYTDAYWRQRDRSNVAVVFFEDLVTDLPGALRRIAEFLQVDLDAGQLDAVVAKSTFASMSAIDEKFYPPAPGVPWGSGQGRMIRQGRSGAASELLSARQRQRIDDHCRRELGRLGSDFPYHQRYG